MTQNLCYSVVVFLFIFATRLNIGGGINLAFVSVFLVFLMFAIEYRRFRFVIHKQVFFLGLFLMSLACYHITLALIYGNNFIYFVSILASVFVYVIFGWCLSFILVRSSVNISNLIDKLIFLCAISVFLNSVVIIFEYVFPVFKDFVESWLLNVDEANINYALHTFRFRGLGAAGGASLSIVNALAILLFIYLALNVKLSGLLALSCSLVIMISNIFTGRTGLIFGIVFVCVFVLVLFLQNVRSGIYGAGRVVVFILSLLFFVHFFYDFDLDPEAAAWAFEWVRGLESGKLDVDSAEDLRSMLFVPDNPIHLLFGIGFFEGVGDLYPRTDSGYLKTLLSFGVVLGALLYFVIAALFFKMYKVSNTYHWLVVSVLAFMFVVEVKEPFLYQNYAARLILLLSGASLFVLSRRTRSRGRKNPVHSNA